MVQINIKRSLIGIFLAIAWYIKILPSPLLDEPESYYPPTPLPKLQEGVPPYYYNEILSKAEILVNPIRDEDGLGDLARMKTISGPESILFDKKGYAYLSVGDGRVLRSKTSGKLENTTEF